MDDDEVESSGPGYKQDLKPFAQAKLLSLTEKCKICGDQAARHVHYGAMSCFSCRAFFRRSIQNKTAPSYTCRRFNQCEVNLRTRKNCQACRYSKCVEVGMKPTWVLTEEERKVRFKKSESRPSTRGRSRGAAARQRNSHEEDHASDHNDDGQVLSPSANGGTEYFYEGILSGSTRPSVSGFIQAVNSSARNGKSDQHISHLLGGGELLVGQGNVLDIQGNALDMKDKSCSSSSQSLSISPSSDRGSHKNDGPRPIDTQTSTISRPEILLKKDPDFTMHTNGGAPLGRPTVLKIKDEPVESNYTKPAVVVKQNKQSPPFSFTSEASHCSVITQNLAGMLEYGRSNEIRDVLKDDPDFNNIDIDLIDASLMDEDGRQLKIEDAINCGVGGDRSTTLGINEIVAHLSKDYDFDSLDDDDELIDDDIFDDRSFFSMKILTVEEENYLTNLVKVHDVQYKSVNFGEEMIKEMMMCSMFGIPISYSAAINGYKLCVERMFKVAHSLQEFDSLNPGDKEILLKVNVDLLVCLRGAIFFDPRKSGKDQVLVSMGDKDMDLLQTMFSQAMKEEASMNHIEYKTFNSVQDVNQNVKEDRYKIMQERVGKYVEDVNVTVLISFIVLFSTDSLPTTLSNQDVVLKCQDHFIMLLEKYLCTKHSRLTSCLEMAHSIEAVSMLREMADYKKSRYINLNVKL